MASFDQLKQAIDNLADEAEEAAASVELGRAGGVGAILKDVQVALNEAQRVWKDYSNAG